MAETTLLENGLTKLRYISMWLESLDTDELFQQIESAEYHDKRDLGQEKCLCRALIEAKKWPVREPD